jgi:hypothetical protein
MNIKPPAQLDQKHRDLVDRLSKLQGAAFDREYVNAMVTGHQEVATELQAWTAHHMTSRMPAGHPPTTTTSTASSAQGISVDAAVGTAGSTPGEQALAQWVARTLPTVEKHLDQARTLQQKVK